MASPPIRYNPGVLRDEELIAAFVVRQGWLDLILEALRENAASEGANRHLLIVGPRGSGKTMLVRRVAAEIARNPDYGSHWHAVVFGEEPYHVSTPGEFWLEALFHLADQTRDARWGRAVEDLRRELDEQRLRERTLGQLLEFAGEQGKRLLLVVENLNMLCEQITPEAAWDLRHTLTNEPRVMLVGTATSRFDEVTEVGRAWFEMLSSHELKPLTQAECTALWQSVTKEPLVPRRAPVIRILSGGNPRLLTILGSFAANRSFHDLMEQLVHLLDDYTEYFKGHLDALGPQERKVFAAVLDRWDPVSAAEVAELTRLSVNETSTLLGRLVGRGAVEVAEQKKRRKVYQAAERLYNLYYLMRRRGRPEARVRLAVRFMVTYFAGRELVSRLSEVAQEACGLPSGARGDHYLAYGDVLGHVPRFSRRIVECTSREFFEAADAPRQIRELARVAPPREVRRHIDEAEGLCRGGRFEEAENRLRDLLRQDESNVWVWHHLGVVLGRDLKKFAEAESAFRRVTELDPVAAAAWNNLGSVLHALGRRQDAEQAYRRVTELDPEDSTAWNILGHLLLEGGPPEEVERVWARALELHPKELAACAVHLLELRLDRGVDRRTILADARAWVERGGRAPDVLASMARFAAGRLKEWLHEAEAWAQEAYSKKPDSWSASGLAWVLVAQGRWEEALAICRPVLDAAPSKEDAQRSATEFLIQAAGAGYVREALETLVASPGAAAMEPLAVGLRIFAGESVLVAKEILEIGQDVAERIREVARGAPSGGK